MSNRPFPFVPPGARIPSDVNQSAATFTKDVVADQNLTVKGTLKVGTSSASKLGFYGTSGVAQPSAAAVVTVADLVAVLQTQGLLGP